MATPRLLSRLLFPVPSVRTAAFTRTTPQLRATAQRRFASNPADQPGFQSILDQPPVLVRTGRKRHGPGLLILIAIPVTAFVLGTWQVKRLEWKTALMARLEDRIVKAPLALPPRIDPAAIEDFDYRRVLATGRFRHDQEMLVGPRIHDGENGYQVVTPLERPGGTKILVNRGWIAKSKKNHKDRDRDTLPTGEVTVEGLLRAPWKKNMFTPDNRPDIEEFYFPDIEQMARLVGAQPVWVEETTVPDFIDELNAKAAGKPIGRAAEVNIRNNHLQYIITWYGLSFATSIMLYILVRKPVGGTMRRVRQSKDWV
ncbi:putative COX1 assembly protein Shy1 [Tricharina praecox]|uniref:putative COX1 assembly protein Shy1 n=1 Tax=Tricharina praecox TaxID=43433 RepID=UPI00221FEEBF|nr:putative COX1 assembly protein Shy1 [Tricharina praecox]KAI5844757.1 putative COX1 assembly protein Shy1 [Tricharina praecox]